MAGEIGKLFLFGLSRFLRKPGAEGEKFTAVKKELKGHSQKNKIDAQAHAVPHQQWTYPSKAVTIENALPLSQSNAVGDDEAQHY